MMITTLPSKVTYCQVPVNWHCHDEFSCGWTVRWQREVFYHSRHKHGWRMTYCVVSSSQSFFIADGSFRYEAAPFGTICSGVYPCLCVNAELVERHLESVLGPLSLTFGWSLSCNQYSSRFGRHSYPIRTMCPDQCSWALMNMVSMLGSPCTSEPQCLGQDQVGMWLTVRVALLDP